jgi:hemerythrin-like domain-containing protein
MCEYCGCRQIEPLSELMDEHLALLDDAGDVEKALRHGERDRVLQLLERLRLHLAEHVRREEDGVFTALTDAGEFTEEIRELTEEHRELDEFLRTVDPGDPMFTERIRRMSAHLSDHIDREDLGIFPVSVVTLSAPGWDTVTAAHEENPSFLA